MFRKICASALILLSLQISAQDRLKEPEMYIGVNAGATGSWVIFNPVVKQSYLTGINGGLVFRYIAEKNVGMQAELNISQRGWKESTGNFAHQLTYLELPFLTHIFIGGQKSRFIINLGPKISYLFNDKITINKLSELTEDQQILPIQNNFDYGLCAGLGFLFAVGKNHFQLDARGSYSLTSIFNSTKKDYFANSNNMVASVNFAWLVKVK